MATLWEVEHQWDLCDLYDAHEALDIMDEHEEHLATQLKHKGKG